MREAHWLPGPGPYDEKLGVLLRTINLCRYVQLTVKGITITWDRDTGEVSSAPEAPVVPPKAKRREKLAASAST